MLKDKIKKKILYKRIKNIAIKRMRIKIKIQDTFLSLIEGCN
jgi:hypothetical protein